jgi:transcriptional regulator with XRE-family HTH domain
LINRVERGETRDPHISTLSSIAEALGVSVAEIMEEEEPAFALGKETAR